MISRGFGSFALVCAYWLRMACAFPVSSCFGMKLGRNCILIPSRVLSLQNARYRVPISALMKGCLSTMCQTLRVRSTGKTLVAQGSRLPTRLESRRIPCWWSSVDRCCHIATINWRGLTKKSLLRGNHNKWLYRNNIILTLLFWNRQLIYHWL